MNESRRRKILRDGKTALQITIPTEFVQQFKLLAHYLSIGGRDVTCQGPDLVIIFDSQIPNSQNKEQSHA